MVNIWSVPILSDNYVWILERPGCQKVAVVDPGIGGPVRSALDERGLSPGWILLTHHHGDHVGGVADLADGAVPVYGPDHIAEVTAPVADGDRVRIEDLDTDLEVLHTPGHTTGHLAYVGSGFALVGDTLFAGGCGRLFEGTPAQMLASLDRLASLPAATSIYCAHEYTEANLGFAARVEPDNSELIRRLDSTRELRSRGEATVPSSLGVELATNPFLRSREPSVIAAAGRFTGHPTTAGVETFAAIRAWKDRA